MRYDQILIVADDSPSSLKAVKYGFELAVQLKSKVALVGVVDHALTEGNVDAGIFPEQVARDLKQQMDMFLYKLKKDYANGAETEIFTPEGEVTETILRMATELDVQLIVAGTHGRKGVSRLLMGSVSEGILRHSKIPALIVPVGKD